MTETASPSPVGPADFRRAMGRFATGVAVVTSVDAAARPVGTTASAVTSLSLNPPLLLVCLDRGSQTLAAVRAHGAFAVNVLEVRQRHLSANFARRGQDAAWDEVGHRLGPTGRPSAPGPPLGPGSPGRPAWSARKPRNSRGSAANRRARGECLLDEPSGVDGVPPASDSVGSRRTALASLRDLPDLHALR